MARTDIHKIGAYRYALAAGAAATLSAMALGNVAVAQDKDPASNWVKVCGDVELPVPNKEGKLEPKKTTLCQTFHEQVNRAFGFLRVAIQSADLYKQDRIQVQVPLGMDLRRGIRMSPGTAKECDGVRETLRASKFPFIEQAFAQKPTIMVYATCGGDGRRSPMSCYAEAEATKELIEKMKGAACLGVQSFAATGVPPVWVIDLKGFAATHTGKAMTPEDLAKIAKAKNDKIQEAIQKKSKEELAKDPKLADAYKKLQAAEQAMADALKAKQAAGEAAKGKAK